MQKKLNDVLKKNNAKIRNDNGEQFIQTNRGYMQITPQKGKNGVYLVEGDEKIIVPKGFTRQQVGKDWYRFESNSPRLSVNEIDKILSSNK